MPLVKDISSTINTIKSGASDMANGALSYVKNTVNSAINGPANQPIDRRARLRPLPGSEEYVYSLMDNASATLKQKLANKVLNMAPDIVQSIGHRLLHTESVPAGLMSVLKSTNGLVFTETPNISETQAVEYSSYDPVHSLARFNNYVRTQNASLRVTGTFHVTNATEARYLLACIHFLRSVVKMDFGRNAINPGTPPPVLLFSAYGSYMFNDIPVIIKSVSLDYSQDVDYIQVPLDGSDITKEYKAVSFYQTQMDERNKVWVPTKMAISLQLEQQVAADWLTNEFNLQDFKSGNLLQRGKGGMI